MNGPEHYREAERLVAAARQRPVLEIANADLLAAQVHATLALTAAMQPDGRAWADATRYDKSAGE